LEPGSVEAGTVTGIKVSIGEPTPEGTLQPRYDEEAQILAAESPVSAEWPYGVDVDGRIVFDLGHDRTLMNLDLHIGRKLWGSDPDLAWPYSPRRGRLVFAEEAVRLKSFRLPLRVTTDGAHLVCIYIGEGPSSAAVALSDACLVMHRQGELTGFLLRLV
jgi:hypothetical protein